MVDPKRPFRSYVTCTTVRLTIPRFFKNRARFCKHFNSNKSMASINGVSSSRKMKCRPVDESYSPMAQCSCSKFRVSTLSCKFTQLAWRNQEAEYSFTFVSYYVTTVLQVNVGLDRNLSLILGGAINAMFLIGSFLPALYLDQMGRRRPMMWGSFGCALSMLMIAILLSFADKGASLAQATSSASVAFFFLVSTTY